MKAGTESTSATDPSDNPFSLACGFLEAYYKHMGRLGKTWGPFFRYGRSPISSSGENLPLLQQAYEETFGNHWGEGAHADWRLHEALEGFSTATLSSEGSPVEGLLGSLGEVAGWEVEEGRGSNSEKARAVVEQWMEITGWGEELASIPVETPDSLRQTLLNFLRTKGLREWIQALSGDSDFNAPAFLAGIEARLDEMKWAKGTPGQSSPSPNDAAALLERRYRPDWDLRALLVDVLAVCAEQFYERVYDPRRKEGRQIAGEITFRLVEFVLTAVILLAIQQGLQEAFPGDSSLESPTPMPSSQTAGEAGKGDESAGEGGKHFKTAEDAQLWLSPGGVEPAGVTVPEGTPVDFRNIEGRWMHVIYVDPEGEYERSGWVNVSHLDVVHGTQEENT